MKKLRLRLFLVLLVLSLLVLPMPVTTYAATGTTTTLTSSLNPSVVGQAVTLTATVTGTGGTPTGLLEFFDDTNATTLSATNLDGTGTATVVVSNLSVGSHAIYANYYGDPTFDPSTSFALNQVVTREPTTTTLTSSLNPSHPGDLVTFTATVTGTGGIPTGEVDFVDDSVYLGTGTLDAAGVATFATSALSAGSHPIFAFYNGDSIFEGSLSNDLNQEVTSATIATATTLTSSSNPSNADALVTFTATVAGTGGTPTGTVAFFDGTTFLSSSALDAAGVATFASSTLSVGSHPITAEYSGDATFITSTSSELTQVVQPTATTTTTTLTSAPNPSVTGESVTFTATVTATSGTPTGQVSFFDGTTPFYGATLDAAGVGTFTTGALSAGSHSITAEYQSDAGLDPSTSSPVTQVVTALEATTTTLASSLNPSVAGELVTLTATVAATSSTPPGMVTFLEGTTALGSGTLDATGIATLNISNLSAGSHPITAEYAGDATFAGSTSSDLTQEVTTNATTTTLTSTPNPSVGGELVTFTATVTATSGTPPGTVSFFDHNDLLGTGTLDATGVATFTISTLSVGSHPIFAVYYGDSTFDFSISDELIQQVTAPPIATTTTLASSPNPSAVGQTVTLTATVAGTSGIPTGLVTFFEGTTSLGTGTLDAAGIATLTTSTLPAGSHTLTATYAGDAAFDPSTSSSLTQDVTASATATAAFVSSTPNPSVVGDVVTFTATVGATGGTPTGQVELFDGTTSLGTATLDAAGDATFAISTLSVGSHSITVAYAGDGTYDPSTSSDLTQVVTDTPIATTTTLDSSPNPSAAGALVTFTATVTGTGGTPTGLVEFFDDTTSLGTGTLDAAGIATFYSPISAVGSHPITAVYAGDATFAASTSAPLTQVAVAPIATTTTLTSAPNPSVAGDVVTFTATVTATSGTPTGLVVFFDGPTPFYGMTLDAAGVASYATTTLSAGSHSITAEYQGDTPFESSTSSPVTQVVTAAATATTTTLASSLNPSTAGDMVTLTATVVGTGGTPTGQVTFFDGPVSLGTETLDATGIATFATSALSAGSHTITATYAGDATFGQSSSSDLTQVVTAIATTTTLTSSLNPSSEGDSVTLTATVAATSGTPTGVVAFFDDFSVYLGSSALDAAGVTTFAISSLSAGSHSIDAVYYGDSTFGQSTSSALTQVVQPTAFSTTTTLTSAPNPSNAGDVVTLTATVTATGGIPTGVVAFFDDFSVYLDSSALDATGVATFTISNLSVGSHSIDAVYAGDGTFHHSTSSALTQVVQPTASSSTTTLTSTPNPSSEGDSVTFTATVTTTSGTPTGSVLFFDGGNLLEIGGLNAVGAVSIATSILSAGSHIITAQYVGDATFDGSISPDLTQVVTVAPIATTTTLASTPNPSTVGQTVTFTATVVAPSGTPTGIVTFFEGTTSLGTGTLDATGVATFDTTTLSDGSHTITAVYAGDGTFDPSTSSSVTQEVTATATATITTLASAPNPSTVGDLVTLTATVVATGGTPTGTVTFFEGTTSLGTGTLDAAGIATFDTTTLSAGSHTITAVYAGDGTFDPSTSSSVTQEVTLTAATTITTLAASPNPSTVGQAVTLAATVVATGGTPTGTVTFLDGTTSLGTGTLNGAGVATFTTSALSAGSHTLTAHYVGNATFDPSTSSPVTQVVTAATVSAPVIINPASGSTTNDTTPTISGTSTAGYVITVKDGTTPICTATVAASGAWTCTPTTPLSVGAHTLSVTATDSAGNVSPAESRAFTIASTTVSTPTVTTPAAGAVVTDTTPTISGTATPGTTVTVKDGTTPICTATVAASGAWTCTPTTPLSVGAHTLSVTATDSAGNVSPAENRTFTIASTTVSTPIITSPAPGTTADNTPTFSGTADPGATVTIKDGTTPICTATVAASGAWTCTPTTSLSDGSHTFTATATDATGTASTPATVAVTIDTIAPAAPVVTGPTTGSTTSSTPTFSGTATSGSTITVSDGATAIAGILNATTVCTATAGANGTWSCTPTTPLSAGLHTISVTATDSAGNVSLLTPITITVKTSTTYVVYMPIVKRVP